MGSHDVSIQYISVGGNRQTAVADWSPQGLLAFGTDTNIALWAPENESQRGINRLLRGHADIVKALTFLPHQDGDASSYLVSGANDKSLIVWKSSSADGKDFASVHVSHDHHSGAINCIAAIRRSSKPAKWLLATGASDATIRIWTLDSLRFAPCQTIKTAPKFFPLSLSLSWLAANVLVLAAAGTQDVIHILTAETTTAAADNDDDKLHFQPQASLRGHEGWIRSLSFAPETNQPGCDLLLASASQDKYVRLWRFHQGQTPPPAGATDPDPDPSSGGGPSNRAHRFSTSAGHFSVTFEALLLGHDDWIYSARWQHEHEHEHGAQADSSPRLRLLTASADNSLAIWEADPASGIWTTTVRLGEMSREKGATTATGSTGGFWTGLWSPDGRSVACLGRTGSWRRWEHDALEDTWRPCVAVSGHTSAVTGIAWAKHGDYLLSTSLDQTTRLHAQWITASSSSITTTTTTSWHEMSRPQIHGYNLNCIDSLSASHFVSGADEKLMRVFGKPRAVASMLRRLGGIDDDDDATTSMPAAANMPVLGLSNKAIDDDDDDDKDAAAAADMDAPPLEEMLSRATLWPETEKLYGHGYELSCLAASHDGGLVASACRASSLTHAVIRLFETRRWTELRPPLAAHTLTATRLRFSPDDAYLLSVGRDRQWAVFARTAEVGVEVGLPPSPPPPYSLLQVNAKGHGRMILDCAWAPYINDDDEQQQRQGQRQEKFPPLFVTAGRDKQVRVWRGRRGVTGDMMEFVLATALAVGVPVTAVDFMPWRIGGGGGGDDGSFSYILAFGTETGLISTYLLSADGVEAKEMSLPLAVRQLSKAVMQLAWRPRRRGGGGGYGIKVAELAVAGDDASLRLYAFDSTRFSGHVKKGVKLTENLVVDI